MEAKKKADRALRFFGEIKRAGITGTKETRDFEKRINRVLSLLPLEEQATICRIYVEDMTNEEAAEADDCDTSTVSRRKNRALARVAMLLYPDQYIRDGGL